MHREILTIFSVTSIPKKRYWVVHLGVIEKTTLCVIQTGKRQY